MPRLALASRVASAAPAGDRPSAWRTARAACGLLLATATLTGCTGGSVPVRPPPPPTPTSQSATPTSQSATVVLTGDLLIHSDVNQQAAEDARSTGLRYDFGPMLAGIQSRVSAADLAVCHLEVPLGDDRGPYFGYPAFSAPPEVAAAIAKVGYDSCSTASNHSFDQGLRGVTSTLRNLDRAKVRHAGTARSADEHAQLNLLPAAGFTVAQLSYAYGLNTGSLPADQSWAVNLIDVSRILADAKTAKRLGADVVLLSLHWGQEGQSRPTAQQIDLARRLTASADVDVIVGHHVHVVQPVEMINGKYVVFGLGNSLAGEGHNFWGGASREGLLVTLKLKRHGQGSPVTVAGVELTPTYATLTAPLRVEVASAKLAETAPRIRQARVRVVQQAQPTPVPGVTVSP
jgi:poly-gamma-glutamate capsule biosynthesis protein CapA/YwtB (metallophosphatase superfamily)